MASRPFLASYPGECAECGRAFDEGEEIRLGDDDAIVAEVCCGHQCDVVVVAEVRCGDHCEDCQREDEDGLFA